MRWSLRALSWTLSRTLVWCSRFPSATCRADFVCTSVICSCRCSAARDFDILEELLIDLNEQGYAISDVPFHYKPRDAGRSHARLLKFGWSYLKTLCRMCVLRFRSSRLTSAALVD
jgi:hypothetical protein